MRLFSIISPLDLSANSAYFEPYGVSASKVVCCGPCRSEPIICTFSVKKSGYIPGELIEFELTIENKSNKQIMELTVSLMQKIKLHAGNCTKRCSRRVAMIAYSKKLPPKSVETWKCSLVIPPVCSSSNGKSRLIEVYYSLYCVYDASGLAPNTELTIPVTIGTKTANPNTHVTYELSHFDYSSFNGTLLNGDIMENDTNTFKPYYPYLKST